ncbi:MAG TPA: hypothetical protein VFB23_12885 [Candidatus Acidoferrales bacterium]|nr:hypothetical protein [Candidatus Acidoferrales bacterium]
MRSGMRFTAAILICFLLPMQTFAWGANAERLIANRAVDTLPQDLRAFFEANRDFITRHAADAVQNLDKTSPTESRNEVLFLDRYGQYPFEALPHKYEAAAAKFGKPKLENGGVLPWQIGVYSAKLTDAMRSGNWEQARLLAAQLAGYVAQAFDPFNTTENYDGHAWGQPGVNLRFNTSLVDRYSLFFPLHPNDAVFIADPTDHAFEDCIKAHSWLEIVLVADRRARSGLADYTDDYYDRFYSEAGATLIRQLSDAAADVGSYWLTAWINAGRPAVPHQ